MQTREIRKNEDDSLIELAAAGDLNSFRILIDRFSGYAYSLAFRTLLNSDDAKDAVQESFISVWKHLKRYNSNVKFTTWLYRIVVNNCYDKLKAEKRRKSIFGNRSDIGADNYLSSCSGPEEEISNKDSARLIGVLSNGLPAKQRMVFILRDLQNLSTDEVSEILEMPAGAVKTNLFYARKFIAAKFNTIEERGK
jgi:RNA polymerase sigma-70 factor, ECF subfamily